MAMPGSSLSSVLVVALVGSATLGFQTGGDGPDRSGSRIAAAMRLMAEAYPDVIEKSGRMQVFGSVYPGTDVLDFGLRWSRGVAIEPLEAVDMSRRNCTGSFGFSRKAFLRYQAFGQCVSQAENDGLAERLRRDRTWTAPQVLKQLQRVNAGFGPATRDAIAERLPAPLTLARLVDENLRFVSLDFIMPREDADTGTQDPSALYWVARYESVIDPDIRVLLLMEPITGKLSSILRSPAEY
jgi:hypothetical protein